jgi:hypothetical protein
MTTIIEKRYIRLLDEYDLENIHKYLDIKNAHISLKDINTVVIKFYKVFESDKILVSILKKSRLNRLNQDMVNEILSYIPVYNYLHLVLNIDYPHDYPFKPSFWSLKLLTTNITNKNINIENHFSDIIKMHNSSIGRDWSPAIYIIPDILTVFMKLDHMDELISY